LICTWVNVNIIVDKFNVGAFIMRKYVDIVINALIFKDKLFSQHNFMVCAYLGIWMDFFMHVAYLMYVVLLMGHIFRFPKSWINKLL
jgi:hypothetical protein